MVSGKKMHSVIQMKMFWVLLDTPWKWGCAGLKPPLDCPELLFLALWNAVLLFR